MSWESDYGDMIGIPYVDTSYDQPRTADTVVRDIVTQRQDTGTSSNDAWGGFFRTAVGSVLDYGIKRDAALTGVQLQAAQRAAAAPTYYPAAAVGAGGLTVSPMLLIVGGLVALLVLKT